MNFLLTRPVCEVHGHCTTVPLVTIENVSLRRGDSKVRKRTGIQEKQNSIRNLRKFYFLLLQKDNKASEAIIKFGG